MNDVHSLHAAERFFHEQIPLTHLMGLRVVSSDENGFVLEAPVTLNHNHLKTAFGGSINALATLAGYGLLWLELRDQAVDIVVRESSIRYLRPIRETIKAICAWPPSETLETLQRNLHEKGKARLALAVRVEENNEVAAEFTGTFVVFRRFGV